MLIAALGSAETFNDAERILAQLDAMEERRGLAGVAGESVKGPA